MSLLNIATLTKQNPISVNQPIKPQHSKPSIQDAYSKLTPTDDTKIEHHMEDHKAAQVHETEAELNNPLISPPFNSQIATSGV